MSIGKHTSRYKSFESLEESRKERSRRRREKGILEEKKNESYNDSDENQDYYEEDYEDDYDEYEEDDEERLIDYRKVIIIIVAIIVVFAIIFGIYKLVSGDDEEVVEKQEEPVVIDENKMPTNIDGYSVLGQVVISSLNIEQYILDSTEDSALDSGVTKIYGPKLNSNGNFCIVGHNYEGIFKDLEKLNVDDEIIIKNTNKSETAYKVTSIKNVEPDNLECLLQDKEKTELTLITCQTGSTQRTVVKAELAAKDNV